MAASPSGQPPGRATGGVAWWAGPLAGVAAAAAALGVAALVAAPISPRSAPLVAVGGLVIDAAPGGVKNFAIGFLGTADKPALLVGTAVLLLLFAGLVGTLSVRRLRYGVAGVVAFGLLGMAAAWTRPGATFWWALPSLLGTLVAVGVLVVLTRRHGRPFAATLPGAPRRRFLGTVGVTLGAAVVAGWAGRVLGQREGVSRARSAVRLPAPASRAPVVPEGAMAGTSGATTFLTSTRDFYLIDTALSAPQIDPRTWRLRVHGRVRRPLTLTFDQLLARPMIERYVTLACVSNEVGGNLIGNAKWLGVPLAGLLDEVGPLDGADQVVSRSIDGYTAGTPTAALRDGRDAMLAVGMNGAPLPVAHGFPVRMVVPGLYGYVSATKWLVDLELSSFADFSAYWVRRGWARQAPIRTESRIDAPRSGDRLPAGTVVIAGVAWAQHRGASAVEVQVDQGAWQRARLAPVPSVDTWRQWALTWQATRGDHVLRVRATDNAGAVQTPDVAPPVPAGATGWHTIKVSVS